MPSLGHIHAVVQSTDRQTTNRSQRRLMIVIARPNKFDGDINFDSVKACRGMQFVLNTLVSIWSIFISSVTRTHKSACDNFAILKNTHERHFFNRILSICAKNGIRTGFRFSLRSLPPLSLSTFVLSTDPLASLDFFSLPEMKKKPNDSDALFLSRDLIIIYY